MWYINPKTVVRHRGWGLSEGGPNITDCRVEVKDHK